MQFVLLLVNPRTVDDPTIELLVRAVPTMLASALHLPRARSNFTADEVTVKTIKAGTFDRLANQDDVQVIVFTNNHAEREMIVDNRTKEFSLSLANILPEGLRGRVWVQLTRGFISPFVSVAETEALDR